MEWIAEIAKEYGLFVALVVYVIWDSRVREQRLLNIIDALGEEIKNRLIKLDQRLFGRREGENGANPNC